MLMIPRNFPNVKNFLRDSVSHIVESVFFFKILNIYSSIEELSAEHETSMN